MMIPDAPSLIVPVFIPHAGCPHQCAFCNQKTITGQISRIFTPSDVSDPVSRYLEFSHPEKHRHVCLAFYGGTFLGLPEAVIDTALRAADVEIRAGRIHSIRFSTRPETVTPEALGKLAGMPVSAVEIGAQSLDDGVLRKICRGHTGEEVVRAVRSARSAGYPVGVQLMVGLPGETDDISVRTARQVASISPDFIRIYPLTILKDSPMGDDFLAGRMTPPTVSLCVSRAAGMYAIFREKKIPVIRMGLQDSPDLAGDAVLGGGHHPAFGALVRARVAFSDLAAILSDRERTTRMEGTHVTVFCHPSMVSDVVGHKKENLALLKQRFGVSLVSVSAMPDMAPWSFDLNVQPGES